MSNVIEIDFRKRGPIASNQESAEYWFNQGNELDENPETYHQAVDCYKQALKCDKTHAKAAVNLGNLLDLLGDRTGALRMYRKAIRIDKNLVQAHYNMAYVHFEMGLKDLALKGLKKTVKLDPTFVDAHFNLALVMKELGMLGPAAHHFRVYLKLDPGSRWAEVCRRNLISIRVQMAPSMRLVRE